MVVERSSVAERAYTELRAAILSGRFAPGTRLVVRPLAEEYGLSATPIKAALAALERDGLIRLLPDRGFFVESFDAAAIKDICAVRGVMDRLAAELAASRPGHAAVGAVLEQNVAAQRVAIEGGRLYEYADLNHEFHGVISQASANRRAARISDSIAGQVRLMVYSSARVPGRPSESLQEHLSIVKAIAAGDSGSAGAFALAHALKSEDVLLRCIGSGEGGR